MADEKPQQSVVVVELDAAHRVNVPSKSPRSVHRRKLVCAGPMLLPTLALVLIGLVAVDVFMETKMISLASIYSCDSTTTTTCVPKLLNPAKIKYHSGHRYYSALQAMDSLPSPVFRDELNDLCYKKMRNKKQYAYCLPISGRKDTPYCTAADRMDLLNVQSPKSICYASVLHMIVVEVYEELQASGNTPFLTFGSMLGAVRNGSMIPFTEDADQKDGNWDMEEFNSTNGSILPDDKVKPFSQVTINGIPFDTVRDPKYFLEKAYGPEYMTPKQREAE
ncbi:hypothetical protein BBJ29_005168 [Phytophthora kernoviae]|uniref:Uncharacterized protein n=1 Tax=Phytophthora kernoviae TaxID=325452 RepID=A0A3F2RMV1_9STRA|nr:hypothetical protein BBJ29_005168 [Phytophthora kernoviae]RLN60338.1 hypothetical protein BBP00_00006041 [Phytophthora kernoviae]